MTNNSQTNRLIMFLVVGVDFVILNALLYLIKDYHPWLEDWSPIKVRILVLLSNIGLLIGEFINPPIVHKRSISAGNVVKRVLQLSFLQGFFAVFLMKMLRLNFVGGRLQVQICVLMLIMILLSRGFERLIIKKYRSVGS